MVGRGGNPKCQRKGQPWHLGYIFYLSAVFLCDSATPRFIPDPFAGTLGFAIRWGTSVPPATSALSLEFLQPLGLGQSLVVRVQRKAAGQQPVAGRGGAIAEGPTDLACAPAAPGPAHRGAVADTTEPSGRVRPCRSSRPGPPPGRRAAGNLAGRCRRYRPSAAGAPPVCRPEPRESVARHPPADPREAGSHRWAEKSQDAGGADCSRGCRRTGWPPRRPAVATARSSSIGSVRSICMGSSAFTPNPYRYGCWRSRPSAARHRNRTGRAVRQKHSAAP